MVVYNSHLRQRSLGMVKGGEYMKKTVLIILSSLALILIGLVTYKIYDYGKYEQKKFGVTFSLSKEPDGIFGSPLTNELAVLIDGDLFIYDCEGQYKSISLDIEINSVLLGKQEMLLLDKNSNLYKYQINTKELSDIILTDVVDYSWSGVSYGAVTRNGDVFVWGENKNRQLGIDGYYVQTPTKIDYIQNTKKIILNVFDYSLILTSNGDVYECGIFNTKESSSRFTALSDVGNVKDIISSYNDTGNILITDNDKVIFWKGAYISNQRIEPNRVVDGFIESCEEHGINMFSSGMFLGLGKNDNGDVFFWGIDTIRIYKRKGYDEVYSPKKIESIKNADAIYACVSIGYVKKGLDIIVIK